MFYGKNKRIVAIILAVLLILAMIVPTAIGFMMN